MNPRNDGRDFSLERLKERLRAFSAVEPPAMLREKLRAGIPAAVEPRAGRLRLWPGKISCAGLAAAVITICVIVWLMPSGRSPRPATDTNNSAALTFAADHNSIRPSDTNGCDSNGLY